MFSVASVRDRVPEVVGRATILVALSAWAGGFSSWFDALNHFAPFWLALSLAAAVVCLFFSARHWAIYCVIAAVAHVGLIAPEFVGRSGVGAAGSTERTIRVVWLNTWLDQRPSEEVLRYLETSGADFVMVTELHDEDQAGFGALHEAYPTVIRCEGEHDCNTFIFAKREPLSEHTGTGLRASVGEFDIDGVRLRLIAAHLARPNPPERQQREFGSLLRAIGDEASNVILAGDFNSTPWSFTLRRFDHASGLQRHTMALPTWPAQPWTRFRLPAVAPFLPIDHVYSGSRWRLVSLQRGPRTSSDHYPIEATFRAS